MTIEGSLPIDLPKSLQAFLKCYQTLLGAYDKRSRSWKCKGLDPHFTNYLAAWVLHEMGIAKRHGGFRSAQEWFLKSRNIRGIWGGETDGFALDATARACVALLIDPVRAELEWLETALTYLLQHQAPQGWWPGEFVQYRSNQPFYGTMLPISFALKLSLAVAGENTHLTKQLRDSQLRLRRFLEERFETGTFSEMGIIAGSPIRTISWGIRIYVNACGERDDMKEALADQLRELLRGVPDLSIFGFQDLYNALHSLGLLGISMAEPEAAEVYKELQRRVEGTVLDSADRRFRYSAGFLLAVLKLWRAHPLSRHFEQFVEPMIVQATTAQLAGWGTFIKRHWVALAGLLVGLISTIVAILELLR